MTQHLSENEELLIQIFQQGSEASKFNIVDKTKDEIFVQAVMNNVRREQWVRHIIKCISIGLFTFICFFQILPLLKKLDIDYIYFTKILTLTNSSGASVFSSSSIYFLSILNFLLVPWLVDLVEQG